MRGQGRVFRPKVRGEETSVWWLDFTTPDGERVRESSGTDDYDAALTRLAQRKHDCEIGRPVQDPVPTTLAAYVETHLAAKAVEVDERTGEPITARWLASARRQLDRAVQFFGPARRLGSIGRADLLAWIKHLRRTMSGGTARHHLNSLSNLFDRAVADELIEDNPVAGKLRRGERPRARRVEARWLEVCDAALLLEAARMYRPKREDLGMPFAYELLATFLFTGGRLSEVLGLEVADVSFDHKTVTFRPNAWRRLKTATSFRSVRLWPQLEKILRPYIFNLNRPPSRLLFPSRRTGREAMLTDFRKLLDAVAERAGWKAGEITPKMFRHTFCAARLQTLDGGAPVSVYTVAKDMGHGGEAMVRRVYGHLGEVRHRSKAVEYRVEQHRDKLGDRLTRIWGVCRNEGQTKAERKIVSR